jgi:exopolysaccharide production protein ExoQ
MSAVLALLLCAVFVFAILWVESRAEGRASFGLLLSTVWILYCASKPIAVWLGVEGASSPESVESGSPADRLFSIVLMLCGVFVLVQRRIDLSRFIRDNHWLVALFLLMAVSVLWSDYPEIAMKRWVRSLGSVIMAAVVLTEQDPRAALIRLLRISAYVLLPISIMLIKYYPDMGVEYNRWSGGVMWVGVTTQKNGLGRLCMICGFFLVWDSARRCSATGRWFAGGLGKIDIFMLFLALFLLFSGGTAAKTSATSLGVFFASCALVLWMMKKEHRVSSLKVVLNAVFFTVFLALLAHNLSLLDSPFAKISNLFGRDSTFTGRTEIWESLLAAGGRQPFLGAGYGSFWINPSTTIQVNQAHNGYLDVFLDLGTVGIVLLGFFLLHFYRSFLSKLTTDFSWACFGIGFLFMALLHNLSESSLVRGTAHIWTLLLYLACVFSRRPEIDEVDERESIEGGAFLHVD